MIRGANPLFATVLLVFAARIAVAEPNGAATLYERLGGGQGVQAIVDTLIDRVSSDPRLGRSFKDTKLSRIKHYLAEYICERSGGPCHYSGDSIEQVHAGHHITQAEFYGLVQDLRDILKERHVSEGATNELLKVLAPRKREVVEPPNAAPPPPPAS